MLVTNNPHSRESMREAARKIWKFLKITFINSGIKKLLHKKMQQLQLMIIAMHSYMLV
jgi:hypothetical protein